MRFHTFLTWSTGLPLMNVGSSVCSSAFYIQSSDAEIPSWYFMIVLISWLISFQRLFLSPLNQVSSLMTFHSVTGDIYQRSMQRVLWNTNLCKYEFWRQKTLAQHTNLVFFISLFIWPLNFFNSVMLQRMTLNLCIGQFVRLWVQTKWQPLVTSPTGLWRVVFLLFFFFCNHIWIRGWSCGRSLGQVFLLMHQSLEVMMTVDTIKRCMNMCWLIITRLWFHFPDIHSLWYRAVQKNDSQSEFIRLVIYMM